MFIVLDAASQLLLSYRDKLSQSFLTDDLVGLLRSEGVISKDTKELIIEDYDNKLDYEPFRAVCVTVADDHQKLKVLADVLLQSSETALLGRELADKCCESIIIIFPNLLIKLVILLFLTQSTKIVAMCYSFITKLRYILCNLVISII